MYKIGIDAEGFNSWGGGIDFIATITEAIEDTGKAETYLLYPADSIDQIVYKAIKGIIQALRNKKSIRKTIFNELTNNRELIDTFKLLCPKTKLLRYKRAENKYRKNIESKKQKCVLKNGLDIVLPSVYCRDIKFKVPQIGYLYDFQHKYLSNLFDEKTIKYRDKEFERQLNNAKYIIVNSKACKDDIFHFFPNTKCEVFSLPFAPFQRTRFSQDCNLEKYNLPSLYYMISNQFWEHKNHLLAFHALEKVYSEGYTNLHIVCTGKMEDNKNPIYINKLFEEISKLHCKDNIHFLGYIPKNDQISIMKNSIGIIQPTLFEGGPGGGMTYNALCLGVCCLISNISVNREIGGYESVFFFDPNSVEELANLIISNINHKREDDEILNKRIKNNKRILGNYLIDNVTKIIEKENCK